ncbi:hypothetical protein NDU88_000661 [Pleurodeles waltl]|uniref:Uncharacterized protein n=1 Tax=Pleurodeles waltl TaxID=8319 RepID=A0AAV7LWZ6_PLEWA|nr:hypothetical protein NDU88_000661 [Pleurodeles waltl]
MAPGVALPPGLAWDGGCYGLRGRSHPWLGVERGLLWPPGTLSPLARRGTGVVVVPGDAPTMGLAWNGGCCGPRGRSHPWLGVERGLLWPPGTLSPWAWRGTGVVVVPGDALTMGLAWNGGCCGPRGRSHHGLGVERGLLWPPGTLSPLARRGTGVVVAPGDAPTMGLAWNGGCCGPRGRSHPWLGMERGLLWSPGTLSPLARRGTGVVVAPGDALTMGLAWNGGCCGPRGRSHPWLTGVVVAPRDAPTMGLAWNGGCCGPRGRSHHGLGVERGLLWPPGTLSPWAWRGTGVVVAPGDALTMGMAWNGGCCGPRGRSHPWLTGVVVAPGDAPTMGLAWNGGCCGPRGRSHHGLGVERGLLWPPGTLSPWAWRGTGVVMVPGDALTMGLAWNGGCCGPRGRSHPWLGVERGLLWSLGTLPPWAWRGMGVVVAPGDALTPGSAWNGGCMAPGDALTMGLA